ncbi:hypothetical protein ABEF93_000347 [Exophiala dermatitidis]
MPSLLDTVFDPSGDVVLLLPKKAPGSTTDTAEAKVQPPDSTEFVGEEDAGIHSPTEEGGVGSPSGTEPRDDREASSERSFDDLEPDDFIEVTVSSKHLALHSRVFRAMFNGNFREKVQPGSQQPIKVPLPEDNPEAMMLILAIVHGFTRKVPRKVSRDMLLQIALLIDKYEIDETLELFTHMWFKNLKRKSDMEKASSLSDWIYISFVTRQEVTFNQLTTRAVNISPVPRGKVALPDFIGDRIEASRLEAIQSYLQVLERFIQTYQGAGAEVQCSNQQHCDDMVLGNLILELTSVGLYPLPRAASVAMSVAELRQVLLEDLRLTSLCLISPPEFDYIPVTCDLRQQLDTAIGQIDQRTRGPTLEDLS